MTTHFRTLKPLFHKCETRRTSPNTTKPHAVHPPPISQLVSQLHQTVYRRSLSSPPSLLLGDFSTPGAHDEVQHEQYGTQGQGGDAEGRGYLGQEDDSTQLLGQGCVDPHPLVHPQDGEHEPWHLLVHAVSIQGSNLINGLKKLESWVCWCL